MARPYESVKDINESNEFWKIFVRVHHKWSVVSRNKEHFEMILVDKEVSMTWVPFFICKSVIFVYMNCYPFMYGILVCSVVKYKTYVVF